MSLLRCVFLLIAIICCASFSINANEIDNALAMDLPPEPLAAQDPSLIQTAAQTEVQGPTGRRPTLPKNKQPKDKLDVALSAIKQDIMVRNRQLSEEKKWVKEVRRVIDSYNKKVKRVDVDMKKTRAEVKNLFKKKKQIENLKIQRKLENKLKDATADLTTLQQALHHVKTKASEFDKTKQEIKKTIYGIHTQLAKLKGTKPKVKAPTDL